MKLYTEEQVKQIIYRASLNRHLTFEDVLDGITPIELPSDEEIKEDVENTFGLVDPILGKSDYRMGYESGLIKGAKWTKELILNQNK